MLQGCVKVQVARCGFLLPRKLTCVCVCVCVCVNVSGSEWRLSAAVLLRNHSLTVSYTPQ